MQSKTFVSWASFGLINFFILSFARTADSEKEIAESIPGSNHGIRKYPKKSKISYLTHSVYEKRRLSQRWGQASDEILSFCQKQTNIPANRMQGFGNCMANIVFYHSIPNNIPGCLWYDNEKYQALFPKRSMPAWIISLLEEPSSGQYSHSNGIESELAKLDPALVAVLQLLKRGIRRENGLGLRLGIDISLVKKYLGIAQQAGFISSSNRLTLVGLNALMQREKSSREPNWSLHIPRTWCVDQITIQPPA